MSVISWDEALPSDTSAASTADDEWRSMMIAMAVGLGESTYWPGSAASQGASAASAGELIPGSARFAISPGFPTGGNPNGFLAVDEVDERLWHIGSVRSEILAQGHMQDRDGGLGNAPFGVRWLVQTGVTASDTNRVVTVTFPTAYNGVPTVDIGPRISGYAYFYGLRSVTATSFILHKDYADNDVAPSTLFDWRSEGTVNL